MSNTRNGVNLEFAKAALCRLMLVVMLMVSVAGCKTSAHSSDPRLKKIDEMLDTELPKGTTMTRVSVFLSSNGYRVEDSGKPGTIVAIVRHIDTETLRPATARVTFHFDSNERLTTYDLAAAPEEPIQP